MGADVESLTKRPLVFEPGLNIMDTHMAMGALESVAPRKSCQMEAMHDGIILQMTFLQCSLFLSPARFKNGLLRLCFLRGWAIRRWPRSRFWFSFILNFIPIASDRFQSATRARQGDYETFIPLNLIYSIPSIRVSLIPLFLFSVPIARIPLARRRGLTASQSIPTCFQYQ